MPKLYVFWLVAMLTYPGATMDMCIFPLLLIKRLLPLLLPLLVPVRQMSEFCQSEQAQKPNTKKFLCAPSSQLQTIIYDMADDYVHI